MKRTVIFKTVGGQSKCPHEEHTEASENPKLEIKKLPSTHVFPDEKMVFEVEMTNLGVDGSSDFVLYVDQLYNDNGLSISLDGNAFDAPREFRSVSKAPESYTKLVVVERGPLYYKYGSVDLVFKSLCEYDSR